MPFISKHGGWVEKYDGGENPIEISLCKGWQMPFDAQNPFTHYVWFSGSFSKVERRFNENEEALWRVQTHEFDDDKWEWFLSDSMRKRWNAHECRYVEDPNDIICTKQELSPLADKFQFPIWVLEYMTQTGLIKNENMFRMIETRKKMEAEEGYTKHTIKERETSNIKVAEFRKQQGIKKKAEVDDLLNPDKDIKVDTAAKKPKGTKTKVPV